MVDVRGDVLRPPHGTTPAAVKANKIQKLSSFKSNENILKREDGSYYVVSANKASSVTLCSAANLMVTTKFAFMHFSTEKYSLAAHINFFSTELPITYLNLGKSCSFGLPRVPFVNCRQFMYLVISLLVLRAGCGI